MSRKTEEKRKAVLKHKQSMDKNTNNKDLKETHLQPLLRSSYKLAAQVMTSDANNIENVKIHIKQCLNELHKIDQWHKNKNNLVYLHGARLLTAYVSCNSQLVYWKIAKQTKSTFVCRALHAYPNFLTLNS